MAPVIRIVTNEFYPRTGGIATYGMELARAIQTLGRDVAVSCPFFSGPEPLVPFAIEQRPSRGSQDPDDLWRLSRVLGGHLRGSPADVLLLAEPAPIRAALLSQAWLDFSKAPLWLVFFGSELARMAANPVWRGLLQKLGRKTDRFVVISEYTGRLACKHFPDWESRLVVAPPGLEPGWLEAFERLERPSTPPVKLLTVARLHPRKGQLEVMEALRTISREEVGSLTYTLVGSGRRKAFQNRIRRAAAGCPHPIRFTGDLHGDALRGAFADAHIFIMASRPDPFSIESFGIVYLEAAAAGLPVIAADVGGVREAVVPGETALLIPPGDPEALRRAIHQLAAHPERRRHMGEAGRRFAASFSWERSARRVLGG